MRTLSSSAPTARASAAIKSYWSRLSNSTVVLDGFVFVEDLLHLRPGGAFSRILVQPGDVTARVGTSSRIGPDSPTPRLSQLPSTRPSLWAISFTSAVGVFPTVAVIGPCLILLLSKCDIGRVTIP